MPESQAGAVSIGPDHAHLGLVTTDALVHAKGMTLKTLAFMQICGPDEQHPYANGCSVLLFATGTA